MNKQTVLAVVLGLVLCLAIVSRAFPSQQQHQDQVASAGHQHGHGHGRVQIKVYRGQSKGHGHGNGWGWGESFAPYGYWVRQPPDNHGWGH